MFTRRFARQKRKQHWVISAKVAFALLFAARLMSAWLNIVHDCDEVFNYWEPLHYLLYGYGLQTWEYRCILPTASDTFISLSHSFGTVVMQ